jgi:uncharacterized protein YndB with AHSA1/START domain
MTDTNPDLDLVLERYVAVPVEKVWAAWTDPALLMQWFTPAPWKTIACEIDLRPGGKFHTVMQSPEGETFPGTGCYLQVDAPRRLVWTSALGPDYRPNVMRDHDLAFTGILTFEPRGSGTFYTARALHGSAETAKLHADMGFHTGWGAALDQLVALMSR